MEKKEKTKRPPSSGDPFGNFRCTVASLTPSRPCMFCFFLERKRGGQRGSKGNKKKDFWRVELEKN